MEIECHVLFTFFKRSKFESASVFHIRKSIMNRLFINAIHILFGLIKIGNIWLKNILIMKDQICLQKYYSYLIKLFLMIKHDIKSFEMVVDLILKICNFGPTWNWQAWKFHSYKISSNLCLLLVIVTKLIEQLKTP